MSLNYIITLVGQTCCGKSSVDRSFMECLLYQSTTIGIEKGCNKKMYLKNNNSVSLFRHSCSREFSFF